MDFRQYDNALGRFNVIDPLAEQDFSRSVYCFAGNNPVLYGDPSGLKAVAPQEAVENHIVPGSVLAMYANGMSGSEITQYLMGQMWGPSFAVGGGSGGGGNYSGTPFGIQALTTNYQTGETGHWERRYIGNAEQTPSSSYSIMFTKDGIEILPEVVIRPLYEKVWVGTDNDFWSKIGNSLLIASSTIQPTYYRTQQIIKNERFAIEGWKTYSNLFRGNQYVSSAAVNEAKVAFNTLSKTVSRVSTGLGLLSMGATYANHIAGNTTDERYYIQQTINAIGFFGPVGAGIAIGLGAVDSIWGDDIEGWIRN